MGLNLIVRCSLLILSVWLPICCVKFLPGQEVFLIMLAAIYLNYIIFLVYINLNRHSLEDILALIITKLLFYLFFVFTFCLISNLIPILSTFWSFLILLFLDDYFILSNKNSMDLRNILNPSSMEAGSSNNKTGGPN